MAGGLLFVWIYGVLVDQHFNKEFGGIPAALFEKGFETTMVVERNFTTKPPAYVRVVELGLSNSLPRDVAKRGFTRLFRLMWRENPRMVLFRHPYYFSLVLIPLYRLLAAICGRRVIFIYKMDSDGVIRLRGWAKTLRLLVWVAASYVYDRLTVETSCGAERVRGIRFINKRRVEVVPNSYSSQVFRLTKYSESRRGRVVLTAARVSKVKGLEHLVRAFAQIAHKWPDWCVKVAGKIEDQAYYGELVALARSLGVGERIVFLGRLSPEELREEYLHSAIFCLPSLRESFGIARLEAMACGLPVVTTEAGCGRELAKLGSIVVPPGDSGALARALDALIADEQLRERISERQQRGLVGWEQIGEQLYRIFEAKHRAHTT